MFLLLARAVVLVGATAAQGGQEGAPSRTPEAQPVQEDAGGQDPAARERRIESLYAGALVGAKDAEDFAETHGYRQLLEILSQYDEDELLAKAARRLDVAQVLADPGAWRGEIVRVRALIAGQRAVRFARPLGERVDVYRAFLTEADGSEGVVVDFLEEPPKLAIQEDVVEVEGVFFRTVRYENKKGAFVEAPYLIARNLRRLDVESLPRSTTFDGAVKILVIAAVAYLCIRILNTMRKGPVPRRSESIEGRAKRHVRVQARAPLQPEPPAQKP
jgi:hypothetical protein